MKFIHTSDWHIGRQLHTQSLLEDQAHVLEQIIDHACTHAVDAVVVAGDLYDRSVPPAQAVTLLDEVLNRLCGESGIPVILIPGNHDSLERVGFGARQLRHSGLYILNDLQQVDQPVVLQSNGQEVAFYGVPYHEPNQIRSLYQADVATSHAAMQHLLERIRQRHPAHQRSVVVAHCFLGGGATSESERPLSVGGADQVGAELFEGFDYVALGHLHGPQTSSLPQVHYSGSILKYSFSEATHQKSVTLVSLDLEGSVHTERLPLWPRYDMRIIEGRFGDILSQAPHDLNAQDYLMVRLTDTDAILDPMGRLRLFYPNLLHLEKSVRYADGAHTLDRENLKRNELEMFHDFYQQITSEAMTPEQTEAMAAIIDAIHRGGELA
jgi:exonuclease SbcD